MASASASRDLDDDGLVQLLGYRPREIIQGVIDLPKPVQHAALNRDSRSSSIGALDRLPLEILQISFQHLDLLSVTRLACTSSAARDVVGSLPAYRDLVRVAGRTLAALGHTDTARLHNLKDLHAALRSSRCASCGEYGEFLHLLTGERCCHQCLARNESLWLTTRTNARAAFKLSAREMKQLPEIHTLTGRYWVVYMKEVRRRWRLVSVKHAKSAALEKHGTTEALIAFLPPSTDGLDSVAFTRWHSHSTMINAPLHGLPKHPSLIPTRANQPIDLFPGLGAVPLPFLNADGEAEQGLWCRGCEKQTTDRRSGTVFASSVDWQAPADIHPDAYWNGLARWARSRHDFLQHVRSCNGCTQILQARQDGVDPTRGFYSSDYVY